MLEIRTVKRAGKTRREVHYSPDSTPDRVEYDRIREAAWQLIDRATTCRWSSYPLVDAVYWLVEAEASRGRGTWIIDHLLFSQPKDPATPRLPRNLLGGGGWPATTHLRLHWLADRDSGWSCGVCGVGLVDVCADDDIVLGADGGRMIRPGCAKRLPSVDHVVPRDLGGSDDPGNLRLTCPPCNSSKGAA